MRIGNSVGLPAFRNTNRANPKYTKSKRKQMRAVREYMEKLAFDAEVARLVGENYEGTQAPNPAEQTASGS